MLVYLRDKIRRSGKTTFSRGELGQILSVYGARVQNGVWKDYAIDSFDDMAIFSIYRSAQEQPLYRITKTSSKSMLKPSMFSIHTGQKALRQNVTLAEVIDILEAQE